MVCSYKVWKVKKGVYMGSIGTNSNTPKYTSEYQYYLDRAEGSESIAFNDWIYNNVSDTFEKGGKEYTILWQNGVFPKVVQEPTQDDPYIKFNVQVEAVRSDKLEDEDKKAKLMYIPDYGTGKGRHTFRIRVYE